MDALLLPLGLVVLASFFQGTFGLGMTRIKPLSWEAWWIVHASVAMVLFPCIWALAAVPNVWTSIVNSPPEALLEGAMFGFLWGIGGILFGRSVTYVGMSLTYGIVMGLAALMGALIPLFEIEDIQSNLAFPYIIGGMVVMLLGVAVVAAAGIWRDKILADEGKEIAGIRRGKAFWIGLVIAVTSGVLSALLNVGFVHAQPVAESVLVVYHFRMPGNTGADGIATLETIARNSSLAAWVVVLAGAFVMNAGYALFLLWKNNSWDPAETKGTFRSLAWAVLAGLFWFAALGIYGQGAALMGDFGPVVGWPMLLGLALIISNVWAFSGGEWKGAAGPFKTMLAGVAVLILACCVLGYAKSLEVL